MIVYGHSKIGFRQGDGTVAWLRYAPRRRWSERLQLAAVIMLIAVLVGIPCITAAHALGLV